MTESRSAGVTTASGESAASPKTVVNDAALRLLPLAAPYISEAAKERILRSVRRLNLGLFRLVVMGEIKKGKSSFINALLSEPELLPVSSDVATSTVFKILYGPERRYKVFFAADCETGDAPPPKTVPLEELASYGTEAGNPGNEKRVDFIGVELPNPLLRSGLVLVDTPGVGGLFKEHRDITWRYAPNADAVIFVLDSVEAVISADEISFLKELTGKFTRRVIFVQTKTDNASEEQWRGWEKRNREVLSRELGLRADELHYFPLSAKEKLLADEDEELEDLEDSGYLDFLQFLQRRLVSAKEWSIATTVARDLVAVADQVRREQESSLDLARETNAEKLREIEEKRRAALDSLNEWQSSIFQTRVPPAADAVSDAIMRARDAIDDHLNPSGSLLQTYMQEITESSRTAEQLSGGAKAIQQLFIARCSERINEEVSVFRSAFAAAVSPVIELLSHPQGRTATDDEIQIEHDSGTSVHLSSDRFAELQSSVIGMGVCSGAVAMAANLALLAFPLTAGFVLVANSAGLIAAAAGAVGGRRQHQKRVRAEALSKLHKMLADTLSQIRRPVLREFEKRAAECRRQFDELVRTATEERKSVLERQLADVKDARQRSQDETKAAIRRAESAVARINAAVKPLAERFASRRV